MELDFHMAIGEAEANYANNSRLQVCPWSQVLTILIMMYHQSTCSCNSLPNVRMYSIADKALTCIFALAKGFDQDQAGTWEGCETGVHGSPTSNYGGCWPRLLCRHQYSPLRLQGDQHSSWCSVSQWAWVSFHGARNDFNQLFQSLQQFTIDCSRSSQGSCVTSILYLWTASSYYNRLFLLNMWSEF